MTIKLSVLQLYKSDNLRIKYKLHALMHILKILLWIQIIVAEELELPFTKKVLNVPKNKEQRLRN